MEHTRTRKNVFRFILIEWIASPQSQVPELVTGKVLKGAVLPHNSIRFTIIQPITGSSSLGPRLMKSEGHRHGELGRREEEREIRCAFISRSHGLSMM